MTRQEADEFALSIRVFGEHGVSCILSPYFNLREEGMIIANKVLKDGKGRDSDELISATFEILSLVGSDSREKSHALMCKLYSSLVDYCLSYNYPYTSISPLLVENMPFLLNKTSDMNARVKQRSLELVLLLCKTYPNSLVIITKPFVTNKMQNIPWKHIKARLDIATELIGLYGLSDGKLKMQSAWSSSNVIKFTKSFVSHTNLEVREAVSLLLAAVVADVPNAINAIADIPQSCMDSVEKKLSALSHEESKNKTKKLSSSKDTSPVTSVLMLDKRKFPSRFWRCRFSKVRRIYSSVECVSFAGWKILPSMRKL